MFDACSIDGLSAHEVADELVRTRERLVAEEARQFLLAAHWADLHAGELVEAHRRALPGMPRLVAIRGGGRGSVDGCPEIEEYAGAELAALLGRSTAAGEQLIADAVAVRHRHPLLWAGIQAGTVRVWVAGQVARRCVRAGLDARQAAWVDAQTTPYSSSLPTKRFLDLVEARIIEADPEAAEERARARALARFVHAGATDEHGLRTLVARASAGDVTYLVAVLDRIAVVLAQGGDRRPHEVLRADALRILGNPARALALLTRATLDEADPALETLPATGTENETLFAHGEAGWMVDSRGGTLPGVADPDELTLLEPSDVPELAALAASGALAPCVGAGPAGREDQGDRALLQALLQALETVDASRLDPVTVLHVHLSETALRSRRGAVRVEGVGPAVLGEVRDWLTHPSSPDEIQQRITLRPVLDAAAVVPVDRYEVPGAMSELASCRTPFEVFPHGTLAARGADDDHVVPYRALSAGGAPGQTGLHNLAKLGRFHHRLKTNGGWFLHHRSPGEYWWRTPHGHWFRVDAAGTHHHGRDPALDSSWLSAERAA